MLQCWKFNKYNFIIWEFEYTIDTCCLLQQKFIVLQMIFHIFMKIVMEQFSSKLHECNDWMKILFRSFFFSFLSFVGEKFLDLHFVRCWSDNYKPTKFTEYNTVKSFHLRKAEIFKQSFFKKTIKHILLQKINWNWIFSQKWQKWWTKPKCDAIQMKLLCGEFHLRQITFEKRLKFNELEKNSHQSL